MTDNPPNNRSKRNRRTISTSTKSQTATSASKSTDEELEVPLKEALSGYSRTADYTRKTQELAQQRQQVEYALAVQRALQAQPAETIRLLARPVRDPTRPAAAIATTRPTGWEQPSTDDGDDDLMDPLERRINQTAADGRTVERKPNSNVTQTVD